MWTRRRIASSAAVLAALALLASLAFHSSEPSYHGKSLSAWLEQARQNKEIENALYDIQLDTPPTRAVRAMGKKALPSLLQRLQTRDTPLRDAMVGLSQRYSWLGFHPQRFGDIQEKTAYAFSVLGPAAKPALPKVIPMLDNPAPEVRLLAAFAIGKIGPGAAPAIPAIQQLITNSLSANPPRNHSTDERALAAYALGAMGSVARPALPQLELLRKDSNLFVRAIAEAAFIKISGTGLDAIIEQLKSPDSTNWMFAAQGIAFLGTNGAPAIPLLLPALQHTNATVRVTALNSLSAIHMSPEITVPAILPLLAATNSWDRANAVRALGNLGPSARTLVPTNVLLQALQDPDENVRAHATNALRQIDPQAARKAGIDSGSDNN